LQVERAAITFDLDGDAVPDVAPRLRYFGNSMGAIMGAGFVPVSNRDGMHSRARVPTTGPRVRSSTGPESVASALATWLSTSSFTNGGRLCSTLNARSATSGPKGIWDGGDTGLVCTTSGPRSMRATAPSMRCGVAVRIGRVHW